MAYIYRVVPFTVDGDGHPIIAGNYVSYQLPGFYVVYNLSDGKYSTKAIINKELVSENFLVGAESDFMATLPTPQVTLDTLVSAYPGDWRTYKYHCINGGDFYGRAKGFGDISKGILVALSVTKLPLNLMPFDIPGDIHGMVPSAPWSCGNFNADSAASVWYGDP